MSTPAMRDWIERGILLLQEFANGLSHDDDHPVDIPRPKEAADPREDPPDEDDFDDADLEDY
jgi:hypothetical protein